MTPPRRPNVILVLADDLGWGDLSCYGATRISTPNLDRLSTEGVRATDAHAASAVCTPSRYSLLTGRYAWRSPLKYGVLAPHGPAIIEPGRVTLASALKTAGYTTGAFGKWHLGLGWRHKDGTVADAFTMPADEILWDGLKESTDTGDDIDYTRPFAGGPTELGFDRFFGIAGSLDMPPYCFLDQDRTLGVPTTPKSDYAPGQRFGYAVPDWKDDEVDLEFLARATNWMQEVKDQPFFLYLATAAPHRPCVPPAFARGRTEAGPRGDAVFLVDWIVGQLLKTLDNLNLADDTVFIFTSDNGAVLLYPEDGDPAHAPNGDWRGQKADVWEGGHREPFVARWPGVLPAGVEFDDLLCLTDVLPSLAAALDLELANNSAEDGIDVFARLAGQGEPDRERGIIMHSANNAYAVRKGSMKALFTTGSGGFSQPVGEAAFPDTAVGQLYDLNDDPRETANLWSERQAVVEELYRMLRERGGPDLRLTPGG